LSAQTLVNHSIATLKPQSNGPLYSNTVTGTLAVADDGWAAVWYSEEGPGWAGAPPSSLLAVPPINDQCTNFILFDVAL